MDDSDFGMGPRAVAERQRLQAARHLIEDQIRLDWVKADVQVMRHYEEKLRELDADIERTRRWRS